MPTTRSVATINLSHDSPIPIVTLDSPQFCGPCKFLVDTGSELNIIRVSSIRPGIPLATEHIITVQGIAEGTIQTLGVVYIDLPNSYRVLFNVFPDTLPDNIDGILGSPLFREGGEISFANRHIALGNFYIPFNNPREHTIEARSAACISVEVSGPKVGYLPRINIKPDVFLGDCIITNDKGKACLRCINASAEVANFRLPVLEVEEFEVPLFTPEQSPESHPISSPRNQSFTVSTLTPNTSFDTSGRIKELFESIPMQHLNSDEMSHVKSILRDNHDLFHLPGDHLGKTNAVTHKIPTTDNVPVFTKQYRYPPIHKEEINKQMQELLTNDIVAPSNSPYNSPLWIVPKKPDEHGNKKWRMVVDYRALNEKSIADAYPLPSINEILDQLGNARYFSVFDLASGFHQIGMEPEDAAKTAFSTAFGHYQYNRMPFGLKNAPATFQRLMDNVLRGLQGNELFVYLDDIVIYARTLEEHQNKFGKLANRLRQANLKLQPSKCGFLFKEVAYLGHLISEDGVKPCPKKLIAVRDFPRPKSVRNIREFLGLAGYYRRFIDKFAQISEPLMRLLKKDTTFAWGPDQEEAFTTLRSILCGKSILQYPDFDEPFNVTCDASGYAIGAVLSQGDIGKDRPVAYASRLLQGAETSYSTIEKECLAIIFAVEYFRPYIYGRQFRLITDHQPLVWMNSIKDPTSRLLRWRLNLAEFEYEIIYKPGKANANADALSRNPVTLPLSMERKHRSIAPPTLPLRTKPSSPDSTETPIPASSHVHRVLEEMTPSTSRYQKDGIPPKIRSILLLKRADICNRRRQKPLWRLSPPLPRQGRSLPYHPRSQVAEGLSVQQMQTANLPSHTDAGMRLLLHTAGHSRHGRRLPVHRNQRGLTPSDYTGSSPALPHPHVKHWLSCMGQTHPCCVQNFRPA